MSDRERPVLPRIDDCGQPRFRRAAAPVASVTWFRRREESHAQARQTLDASFHTTRNRHAAPLSSAIAVSSACLALTSSAGATVFDQGRFSQFEVFPEMIVTDLPCLEGTEFLAHGYRGRPWALRRLRRGLPLRADREAHFTARSRRRRPDLRRAGQAVAIVFNGPPLGGDGVINFTLVNNDTFVAIEDGRIVQGATIRIQS